MAIKLCLISIERDGYVRIGAEGAISGGDFGRGLANPLENLLGANWASQRVLLSLDQTHYIDSAAIGWLISCQREFKSQGGSFVVHSVRPGVRQMLDLLKIGRIVSLADNEQSGRAVLLGGGVQ